MDYCVHCGAKLMARWERISPLLIKCLQKMNDRVRATQLNNVCISKDLGLTKNEYNNFQKLRYHGLIAHVEGESGHWLITRRGSEFLTGSLKIPIKVKIYRNLISERCDTLVSIADITGTQPYQDKKIDIQYESILDSVR